MRGTLRRMRAALTFLAARRWAGVGSALLAELLLLAGLSFAPPSTTIGIPASVAAAIAGTVAVVFGVTDGVAVAVAGAVAFAALGGWGDGELAAIAVWPLIVAAVGLFARRVERHRVALRQLVQTQEDERRALALTLHDDSAQTLTGALLTLRASLPAGDPAAAQTFLARELISETIDQLRRIAGELSPKTLEDHGLAAALERLAASPCTSGESVVFEAAWDGRLSTEAERALFRFAQAALAAARLARANLLSIRLESARGRVAVTVNGRLATADAPAPRIEGVIEERIRLLAGRLSATVSGSGELALRADIPAGAV